ncbi:MAG: hypothetical protein ACLQU1_18460 [Bryobacteraceae bacterium]
MELTGPEAPVIENVGTGTLTALYSFCDSGLLVYMKGDSQNKTILTWADRKGVMEPFTEGESWDTGRLSPDGRRIASQIHTGKTTEGDIWIYDVDRHTKTRLTSEGVNEYPIWAPDGRQVTFGATIAGKHGIYSVAADGSGKPELLLATESRAWPTSWSPDGKALVYSMPGTDQPALHIWVLPVEVPSGMASGPGRPYRLHDTAFHEGEGEVSPDGHWLAYTSTESGSEEVYVQPFPGPGGKVRISAEGGYSPRWSKNGRELFYRDGANVMSVDVQTTPQFHAGIPSRLFAQRGGTTWDVAPDGKRFLLEQIPTVVSGSSEMVGVENWFEELRRRVPAGK